MSAAAAPRLRDARALRLPRALGVRLAVRFALALTAALAYAVLAPDPFALARTLWEGSRPPMYAFGQETWLAAGAPLVPLGWAGAWVFAHVAALGAGALAAAAALLAALAVLVTERRASARAGTVLGAAAAVVALAVAATQLHLGTHAATSAFFAAAFWLALDGPRRRLAIPIAVVWCNFGADGLLAPAFALAALAGRAFDMRAGGDGRFAVDRESAIVFAGCALATLCTPAGPAFVAAAAHALHFDGRADYVRSLAPSDVALVDYRYAFTAVLLGAIVVAGGYAAAAGDALALVVALLAVLADGAELPLFGVVAAPILAGAAARRRGREPLATSAAPVTLAALRTTLALAALTALAAGAAVAARPLAGAAAPYPLIARTVRDPDAHALFCVDVTWCDAALGSGVRIGVDGRGDRYPQAAVTDQRTLTSAGAHWRRILRRGGVDRVIVARRHYLAGLFALDPQWRERDGDGFAVVFERVR